MPKIENQDLENQDLVNLDLVNQDLENLRLENRIHEYIASREFFNRLKEKNPEAFAYTVEILKFRVPEYFANFCFENSNCDDYQTAQVDAINKSIDRVLASLFSFNFNLAELCKFMWANSAVVYKGEEEDEIEGGVVVNSRYVLPMVDGYTGWGVACDLYQKIQNEEFKLNRLCSGFKFFWVEYQSEIFAANSIEDLKAFDGLEDDLKGCIEAGDFGELPPNHRVLSGFDSCFTLYELLEHALIEGMVEINPDKTLNHPVRIWSSDSE